VKAIRQISAFAMVEIVLALGVAAFALVAILGLLSVGMGSSKESTNDTVLVTMANQLLSDLHRQYFVDRSLIGGTPAHLPGDQMVLTSGVLPGTDDVPQGSTPAAVTPSQIFFDVSGTRLQNTDYTDITDKQIAVGKGAVYQCAVTIQGDVNTLGSVASDGTDSTQAVNLVKVTLTFKWPVQASIPPNTKIIHASIARH
jgi:type II secretory pathway pseudopilin PulG